ncbi:hypothetical protein C5E00_04965 [Pectobacterium parmentieri]|uniref:Uncharacterized protein n=1 Tax=Pectobacterium parmentieri TaxID=1905730 RepID=A0A8B3F968_PECPM|nr:hypothetical protein C5E00_04965 [Pectobacterium parmentieri]
MRILDQRIPGLLFNLAIGVAIAVLYWQKSPHMPEAAIPNLMTTLASVFATLLGFIITAVALLVSLLDKPLLRNMQKTGHYRRLMTDAFDTCLMLLILVLTCLIGLMLHTKFQGLAITVLIGIVTTSVMCLLRTGRRLFNIIKVLS